MPQPLQIESWLLAVDRETTQAAYAQSLASQCDCSGCRNFRVARSTAFPPNLLGLFDKLGIDPQKEMEIYDLGFADDESSHLIQYGGWYHLVGYIDQIGKVPIIFDARWSIWFTQQIALPKPAFRNLPLVQLEIEAKIPWVLNEPYSP